VPNQDELGHFGTFKWSGLTGWNPAVPRNPALLYCAELMPGSATRRIESE
jgi:hypothetical protein